LKENQFQVAIIGAGPAGSTCAIQLSRLGLDRVLLVESGEYEKFRIGESIPPDTNVLFEQLGLYHDFVVEAHEPCYGSCSFWGDERRGYNDFLLNPHGNGWHLDRRRFDHFLANKARAQGATLLTNTAFQQAEKLEAGGFEITLCTDKQHLSSVTADIVVDASGGRAIFATAQGSQKTHTLPLVCLGVRFKTNDSLQKISKLTHLEAVEYGWWYAARIPDEMLLVALYTTAEIAKSEKLNQMEAWVSHLNATPNTQKLTLGLEPVEERPRGFQAPSFRLDKVAGDNWLAIGDAASTYDPITAQGIIKSITNGLSAAVLIHNKLNGGISNFSLYSQEMNQQYAQYLEMRQYFYQMEQRWPNSRFWKEMHGAQMLAEPLI